MQLFINIKNKILKIFFIFLKRKAKTKTARQKKDKIRAKTLKQLSAISRKRDKHKIIVELSVIVREFLKNYFGIMYEFTDEELAGEMTRRRIDKYLKKKSKRVLERLSETQYNTDHSSEELEILIKD